MVLRKGAVADGRNRTNVFEKGILDGLIAIEKLQADRVLVWLDELYTLVVCRLRKPNVVLEFPSVVNFFWGRFFDEI